jgi:hypothetical protein
MIFCHCNNPVVRINLKGGLGNQLFIFFTGMTIAIKTNSQIYISGTFRKTTDSFSLDFLGMKLNRTYFPYIKSHELKLIPVRTRHRYCSYTSISETSFRYSPIKFDFHHVSIDGYFQSYKYFSEYEFYYKKWFKKLLEDFRPISHGDLVIHFRFGDMARNAETNKIHGIISVASYKNILENIDSKFQKLTLVTDDIQYFKQHYEPIFLGYSYYLISNSKLDDFMIMYKSKEIFISNSTFAWWAAWLGDAIVHAPLNWFSNNTEMDFEPNDFFPKNWKIY